MLPRALVASLFIVVMLAACAYGAPVGVTPEPPAVDASVGWTTVAGADLVAARGCPLCHQSANLADGVLSGQTTPSRGTEAYGSNLTPDLDTGLGSWSEAAIARALRKGVDVRGDPLCDVMPRYRDMDDDEARVIARYVQSLPAVRRSVPKSACDAPTTAVAPDAADAAEDGGVDTTGDAPNEVSEPSDAGPRAPSREAW